MMYADPTTTLLAELRALQVTPRLHTATDAPAAPRWARPPMGERPTRLPADATRAEWHAYRLAEHAWRNAR